MKEVSLNSVGGQVMTHIPYFNTYAKGCARLAHDSSDNGAVTMKSTLKNEYITQTITLTGKVDPNSGLVVSYHEQIENVMASGPPSSITRDFKLRQ